MGEEAKARQVAELGNERMENRFPDFIEQNPWAKGMSVNDFKAMGPTLASLEKRKTQENMLDADDVPTIEFALKNAGYSEEEAQANAPALVGQPYSSLRLIKQQRNNLRGQYEGGPIKNEWGIPVSIQQREKGSNKFFEKSIPANMEVSKKLASIGTANNAINIMYERFAALSPNERKALSSAAAGVTPTNIAGDEMGAVQRLKGVVNVALTRPGMGGVKGEKLKGLMSAIEANIPLIARGLGHTGVLTELDVIKSFGVTPDPKGTEIENAERRSIYNAMLRGNVDNILGGVVPVSGVGVDKDAVYRRLGIITPPQPKAKKSADDRVDELIASGMSEDEAYEKIAQEGGY
jgi:hypothetical protein